MPFPQLTGEAHRLLAVVALVVVWWVTEAIPLAVTSIVGASLVVVCGVASATDAFAPFASPTIFLFMGSFMVGRAISEHRLDQRLALVLLRLPGVAGDAVRMRLALGGLTFILSAWMSNTATAAMMLPIALGILGTAHPDGQAQRGPFTTGFLLTIAYAASIGGIMTPVGTPPNLITLGLLEELADVRIDFFSWMLLVTPIAVVYAAVLFVGGVRLFPRPHQASTAPAGPPVPVTAERRWSPGQRNCAIAFGMAVTLWVLPGFLTLTGLAAGTGLATMAARLDEGVVAILAAGLLFVLPVDWSSRRFTLDWPAASRIDWGTILLFGGGLSLGKLMFTTGLAGHIGRGVVDLSGVDSLWGVTAVATLVAIVLTEVTSNTASTSMMVPVVLSICEVGGLNPIPPALGACLGASLAFMLPISTPPNAIVYGSGLVPITSMIRHGLIMDAVGFVLIFGGLRIMCPLLGFV